MLRRHLPADRPARGPGFEADILVLDDSGIRSTVDLDTQHRLERFCYEANAGGRVDAKFVAGRQIF